MTRTLIIAAVSAISILGAGAASAGVEFGKPDFSNYLAPPGWGTCEWWTEAWLHACPGDLGVAAAPAAAEPAAAAPGVVKAKKKGAAAKPAK
jgi:hypothetical protein